MQFHLSLKHTCNKIAWFRLSEENLILMMLGKSKEMERFMIEKVLRDGEMSIDSIFT